MSILLTQFRRELQGHFNARGITVRHWHGGTSRSRNLVEVGTSPTATILYIKESNNSPGFWGLTGNQIERLRISGQPWFAVFLHLSPFVGYLLTGDEVVHRVEQGDLTLSGDGDYKVHEGSHLGSRQRFGSFDDFLARVF